MRTIQIILILCSALPFISCVETPPLSLDNTSDVSSPEYSPRVPSSINAILISDSLVGIYWNSLKIAPGGFIIQRRSQHQGQFQTIAAFPKENFETPYEFGDYIYRRFYDSLRLKRDTIYYYRVAAYQQNKYSPFSDVKEVKAVLTSPSAITFGGDSSGIVFHWTMDNNFSVFTKIERKELNGTYSTAALIPSSESTFKDSLALPSKQYVYRFSTVTANNASIPTSEINAVFTVISAQKTREIATNMYMNDMIVSDDESIIVMSDDDGWIRSHRFSDGTTLQNFNVTTSRSITTVALDPSKTILAVNVDPDVYIYNLQSEYLTATVATNNSVAGMAISSTIHGKYLATATQGIDMPVKQWDLETGALKSTLPVTVSNARNISINPEGTRIVTGGLDDVSVWDLQTNTKISSAPNFRLIQSPLYISASEIFAAYDGSVKELTSNTTVGTYTISLRENSFAFLPDRSLMAIATNEGSWLYDLKHSLPPLKLEGLTGMHRKIFFTKDKKSVFAGGTNGKIFFWKLNYGWSKKQ